MFKRVEILINKMLTKSEATLVRRILADKSPRFEVEACSGELKFIWGPAIIYYDPEKDAYRFHFGGLVLTEEEAVCFDEPNPDPKPFE